MTSHEKRKLRDMPTEHNKFWVPTMWFSTLLAQCMEEGRIRDEIHLKTLLDEVAGFKAALGMLYSFDWISIPLVYTQVTTLAVYGFFFACLMGRQYIEQVPDGNHPRRTDLYVPLFTLMQFFFYLGWLKVAEVLINPFGEDEDDFETNWIIDRNYQVAMLGADELYGDLPILEKDLYWDDLEPELPYTKSTICHKSEPFMGSTADFSLDPGDIGSQMVNTMETIPENVKVDKKLVDVATSVVPSAISSPARFRHFLSNITSAFSNESIVDSPTKDLRINSLHNVKDGIRDPMFYQSPMLQRVKSNSVKRSLSHTDHLSPTKRGGSMTHMNFTSASDTQPFHTPTVGVTMADTGPSRVSVTPMNLMTGDYYPRPQTSHGSVLSLCVPHKDTSVLKSCPNSSLAAQSSAVQHDKAGDFAPRQDPLRHHIVGTDSQPNSSYQRYSSLDQSTCNSDSPAIIATNDAQPVFFNQVPDPPDYGSCTMGTGGQQTTPFYTSYASVLRQPQSMYTQVNGPMFHPETSLPQHTTSSDAMPMSTSDMPPTTDYSNLNHLQSAHCKPVWSENGGNITSAPLALTMSTPPVFPTCDSSSVHSPDESDSKNVHWADEEGDLPAGSEASNIGNTDTTSKLMEGKADSQDSIDSTYDSNYDTVNSQHPLLNSAR
ncbi:uncharacterized protein LOC135467966 isoform X2 [Liolophura sinensis]